MRPIVLAKQSCRSSDYGRSMAALPRPTPTSATATKKMRSNRRVDTKPEIRLRSALHRAGLRFRKDCLIRLPNGRKVHPDVVFTRRRVAVFVDGCFWHSCPQHGTTPKSNTDYWIPKLRENIERDRATDSSLQVSGWQVVRVWTHVHEEEAVAMVMARLDSLQTSTSGPG